MKIIRNKSPLSKTPNEDFAAEANFKRYSNLSFPEANQRQGKHSGRNVPIAEGPPTQNLTAVQLPSDRKFTISNTDLQYGEGLVNPSAISIVETNVPTAKPQLSKRKENFKVVSPRTVNLVAPNAAVFKDEQRISPSRCTPSNIQKADSGDLYRHKQFKGTMFRLSQSVTSLNQQTASAKRDRSSVGAS